MNSRQQVQSNRPTRQPLRLVPGVVIVVLQWLIRFGVPLVVPGDEAVVIGVFAGLLGAVAIAMWWGFFSRAPRSERWGAIVLMIVALVVTSRFLHVSIATASMGLMFIIYSLPVMSLAFVLWAVATPRLANRPRRATLLATVLLASGMWTLLRTEGMTSDLHNDFAWRWSKTREERFLAQTGHETLVRPAATGTGASWPGFRGLHRDGIVRGVRINTDWIATPPRELWRRPIGPGCSSVAVSGELLYTQEQRGKHEIVSCYHLPTGKPVWIHRDTARFWDSHAGPGPRATPTLCDGRLYTMGATGILNALNARDGAVLWSRNVASDTGAKDSGWGFTGSPLVVGELVIVAATGKLAAYHRATGTPRWFGPDGGKGYSSPHLMTLDGVAQILLMSDAGVTSLAPADGALLWKYAWRGQDRVLQPALTADGDILLAGNTPFCLRRITVARRPDGWKVTERWTSHGLKPNFNDFVLHNGHAYGLNGRSLACIDIADGKQQWQGERYGGQIILLADQDVLLVLSEKGELALAAATPDQFRELARFPALHGKTWNHPVLAGNVLIVRNTREMVAFRLSGVGRLRSQDL